MDTETIRARARKASRHEIAVRGASAGRRALRGCAALEA
jgi:hypothetical protein